MLKINTLKGMSGRRLKYYSIPKENFHTAISYLKLISGAISAFHRFPNVVGDGI